MGENELLAKLNKRRSIVEEDGLHFESTPAGETSPPSGADRTNGGQKAAAVTVPTAPKPSAGNASDLKQALLRRRATVDGDGETFESKPTAKVADCGHDQAGGVQGGGGGGLQFESTPQAQTADCGHETIKVRSPSKEVSPPRTQPARVPQAADTEQAAAPPKGELSVSELPAEDTEAAAASQEGEAVVEDEEEEEEEGPLDDDRPDEALEATEEHTGDGEPETGPCGEIKVYPNRTTWLVGLRRRPVAESFESEPFEIGRYGPVTLRLQREESGCTLTLRGASPRPTGLRVGLFAGKGWKKRTLSPWPDGTDLEERFDINLSGRNSVLCGLVFQDGAQGR